jgi:hypothetical protein
LSTFLTGSHCKFRPNTEGFSWFTSVREKLEDPAYAGFFLKFNPNNSTPYHVPQCDTNFSPPKCSNLYHDQEKTLEFGRECTLPTYRQMPFALEDVICFHTPTCLNVSTPTCLNVSTPTCLNLVHACDPTACFFKTLGFASPLAGCHTDEFTPLKALGHATVVRFLHTDGVTPH